MLTTEEIKQRLPHITKTIGGHHVRELELIEIKNNRKLIIGEMKLKDEDDTHWSSKNAVWTIAEDGIYAIWSGQSKYFDFDLITSEEWLDKKENYIKTLTHTKGGYPVRNLHLVRDGYFNDGVTYIRGDYYREEIKDWVINELWLLDGEHLIESTDFHLNMII